MLNTKNIVFNSENITNKETKQEILEFIDDIIGKAIREGYGRHGTTSQELYTEKQREKLFSKEIEDYQQNNNKQKGDIYDAVVSDITNRLTSFISQCPENNRITLQQTDHATITLTINNKYNIQHKFKICNCQGGKYQPYYTCDLPKNIRTLTKETTIDNWGKTEQKNVLYNNTIKKQMFNDCDSIQDIILGLRYKSTEEYNEYKQDNVTMNFFHNDKDKITKIQLIRDYWIGFNNYQEITEFFLKKNGNISKINKYKKKNDKITENIHNETTDKNTIKNAFQQAFNTKDVAIRNILAELNSKQKTCIDNIKQQLKIKEELKSEYNNYKQDFFDIFLNFNNEDKKQDEQKEVESKKENEEEKSQTKYENDNSNINHEENNKKRNIIQHQQKNKEEENKEDLNNSKDTNININNKDIIESKSQSSNNLDNSNNGEMEIKTTNMKKTEEIKQDTTKEVNSKNDDNQNQNSQTDHNEIEIKLEDGNEANKNNNGQKGWFSCKNNCDCGLSKLFSSCCGQPPMQ